MALQGLDERQARVLMVHARGAVGEELIRDIAEAGEDLRFGRIKVEHIRREREKQVERDL